MKTFFIRLTVAMLAGALDSTAPAQSRWELQLPKPTPHGLLGAAHGNGRFVAVGLYDTIISSADAITWVSAERRESFCALRDVTFGNGRFVAIGHERLYLNDAANDGTLLRVSEDGLTWQNAPPLQQVLLHRLVFAHGLFIGVGERRTPEHAVVVTTSPDGSAWTERWPRNPPNAFSYSLAYAGITGEIRLVVLLKNPHGLGIGISLVSDDGIR